MTPQIKKAHLYIKPFGIIINFVRINQFIFNFHYQLIFDFPKMYVKKASLFSTKFYPNHKKVSKKSQLLYFLFVNSESDESWNGWNEQIELCKLSIDNNFNVPLYYN